MTLTIKRLSLLVIATLFASVLAMHITMNNLASALFETRDRAMIGLNNEEQNGYGTANSLSGDGSLITFTSTANNLVGNDINGTDDVFIYDFAQGTTTLISTGIDGNSANANSFNATLSKDGSTVVYVTRATNITSDSLMGNTHLYLYDVQTAQNSLLLTDFNLITGIDISNNGSRIVITGRENGGDQIDVFLIDIAENSFSNITGSIPNEQGMDHLYAVISGNGEYIVYERDGLAFPNPGIIRYEISTTELSVVQVGNIFSSIKYSRFGVDDTGLKVAYAIDRSDDPNDEDSGSDAVRIKEFFPTPADESDGETVTVYSENELNEISSIGLVSISSDGNSVAFSYDTENEEKNVGFVNVDSLLFENVCDMQDFCEILSDGVISDQNNQVAVTVNTNTEELLEPYRYTNENIQPSLQCNGLEPTILGTEGDDVLTGTSGVDVIMGLGGNDTIKGKQGDDIICGGEGNDTIHGDRGDDTIFGQAGNDTLKGNENDDTIIDTEGNNIVEGGMDSDTITTGDGDDDIEGNQGADTIIAGNGDNIVQGGTGADTITTGDGDDDIEGNQEPDIITSGAGNDVIEAGFGDDVVDAGEGDDVIEGNQGADFLDGGAGSNSIDGGTGTDTCDNGILVNCELFVN